MLRLGVERAKRPCWDDADLLVALEDGVAGDGGIEEAVGFDRTAQVGIVVGFLRGVSRRKIRVRRCSRCRRLPSPVSAFVVRIR